MALQGWFCLAAGGLTLPLPIPGTAGGGWARRESHLLGMGPQALQRNLGEVGIADTDPPRGGCVTAFKNLGLKLSSIQGSSACCCVCQLLGLCVLRLLT